MQRQTSPIPVIHVRQLLRRALAIAVLLSVMLSTLGAAHASCEGMGGMAGVGAMGDMAGMAGMPDHDTSAPAACDHGPDTAAESGSGATTCMLVAHCGTTMVAADGSVALAVETITGQRASAADASPHERALEPDSPPPRG